MMDIMMMNDWSSLAATLIVILVVFQILKRWSVIRKLPPGPYGLPFVGILPFLPEDPSSIFTKYRKRYGRIFCMKIGFSDVVMVSDFAVMKKIMFMDEYKDRPDYWFYTFSFENILIQWSGAKHKEQRDLTSKVLRHLGVGQESFEDMVREEVSDFFSKIKESGHQQLDIYWVSGMPVGNIVNRILVGEKLDQSHPAYKWLYKPPQSNTRYLMPVIFHATSYIKVISFLTRSLPGNRMTDYIQFNHDLETYLRQKTAGLRQRFDSGNAASNFVTGYISEVRKTGVKEQTDLLHGSLTGLADGAMEPIRLYLSWFFLLMMKHPDVMSNVMTEVKEVIHDQPVSMSQKSSMPFTQSTMMEVYRYSSMAPMQFFHATNKDVMLTEKYALPKGTQVICDMGNMLHDPEYFPNPDEFDAARFLRDGQYVHDEKLAMFGIGKRPCPGRKISEVILFHMIMSLMREFDIYSIKPQDELNDEFELTFLLRKPKDTPVMLGLQAKKG